MTTITLLATPAAVLALVNLAKRFGITGPWATLLAVLLGVGLTVADYLLGADALYGAIATGLILGLGAAGLYDVAVTVGTTAEPRRAIDGHTD